MTTNPKLIYVVVGSIAGLASIYVLTMAVCIVLKIEPTGSVIQAFNHSGDILLGALIGVLVNTRSQPAEPTETKIVNPPNQPIPTTETK